MECPKPSVVVSALILLVRAMAAAGPGIALKLEPTGTSSHIPPILDCAPAPAGAELSNDDLSAFRGNVLALLGALPASAAAQAPTAGLVATAQSAGAVGDDRAFARAFCFGPVDCLECLSAAAQDVADGCHGRRGAVWRAGCFVSYADTNASSTTREDAWRGWFYDDRAGWFYDDDDTPTTAACMATSTAAECARCLNESVQVVPALKEGRKLSLLRGNAVVVVGYSCYMRVPLFPATRRWVTYAVFDVVVVVMLIEIGGLLFCIRITRQLNSAA